MGSMFCELSEVCESNISVPHNYLPPFDPMWTVVRGSLDQFCSGTSQPWRYCASEAGTLLVSNLVPMRSGARLYAKPNIVPAMRQLSMVG